MIDSVTTIILVRHGALDNPEQIMYGRTLDMHLSEKGQEQVKKTAEKIKAMHVTPQKVYSSPLSRTMESAKILSEVLETPGIIKEEGLIEVDIPAQVGFKISEMKKLNKQGI